MDPRIIKVKPNNGSDGTSRMSYWYVQSRAYSYGPVGLITESINILDSGLVNLWIY